MAERSRSEELKIRLVYLLLFTVIYTLVVIISSFYMLGWTWGEKQNIFHKVFIFIFLSPFNVTNNLLFIPINGFAWGVFTLLIYKAVRLLK